MSLRVSRSSAIKNAYETLKLVTEHALKQQQVVAQGNAKATGKSTDFTLPLQLRHTENVAKAAEALETKHITEISQFLLNQKEYKDLLHRYQGSDVDSPERVKKSARRVGLDLPEEVVRSSD